jgi:hypothetical protein
MLLLMLSVGLVLQMALALGLRRWGLAVAARLPGVWWRRMTWAPIVALTLSLTGAAVAAIILVRTFIAVSAGEPSEKATRLAQGISAAMNTTAFFAVGSTALFLASAVVFFVGWLRATD